MLRSEIEGSVPRRAIHRRPQVPLPKQEDTRQKAIEWRDPRVCAGTRQCYGPDCVYRARPGSKYCSDACGIRLAEARIRNFLPAKFKASTLLLRLHYSTYSSPASVLFSSLLFGAISSCILLAKAWKEAGTPVACERARAKLENILQQRSNQHAKMAQINAERHALRTLLAALDDIEPVDTDDVDAEEENPALVHMYSRTSKTLIRMGMLN